MGIFIKFECSHCGEYECDCPMELRNPKSKEFQWAEPPPPIPALVLTNDIEKVEPHKPFRIPEFPYQPMNIYVHVNEQGIKMCEILCGDNNKWTILTNDAEDHKRQASYLKKGNKFHRFASVMEEK